MKEYIIELSDNENALSIIAKAYNLHELIRCKDCKNADYGTDEDGNIFMKCIGSVKCYGGTTPDFFCADGERRDDADE